MKAKFILAGFSVGILANIAGVILYTLLFSNAGIIPSLQDALENDYLGKIIALGAALNFVPFFLFVNKNVYCARGVLLATLNAAIAMAIFKFL